MCRSKALLADMPSCVLKRTYCLHLIDLGGYSGGVARAVLITVAVVTVVASWVVVNTVYTLRYGHLHYRSAAAGF